MEDSGVSASAHLSHRFPCQAFHALGTPPRGPLKSRPLFKAERFSSQTPPTVAFSVLRRSVQAAIAALTDIRRSSGAKQQSHLSPTLLLTMDRSSAASCLLHRGSQTEGAAPCLRHAGSGGRGEDRWQVYSFCFKATHNPCVDISLPSQVTRPSLL